MKKLTKRNRGALRSHEPGIEELLDLYVNGSQTDGVCPLCHIDAASRWGTVQPWCSQCPWTLIEHMKCTTAAKRHKRAHPRESDNVCAMRLDPRDYPIWRGLSIQRLIRWLDIVRAL